ncbi:hypothetical protein BEL04_21575 [Mucilaginibacter sp. PPCGB 2223]|uniref:GNAT family N-acetyltransferase n=1 Tax=Mucilaginibacter sp. PPCGB 2223 TaxID=1886027 RepID=UPI000825534D|nr:GNAT family N-acetyltransferase [Mucilaginibacter sp. PPCGB 2223]OCX50378.1 hypothetical protein BEL04_21575 [Mucilaginibacter sp. PPCGB 2223]
MSTIIARTPRLIIREFLPEEKEHFFTLMADTRINAYLPKRSHQQIYDVFTDTIADYLQGIKLTRWGMFDVVTGELAGLAILRYNAEDAEKAELGYALHLHYHGRGLATEMAKTLVRYGFEVMQLREIIAVTVEENSLSHKVLLKAGLKRGDNTVRSGEELAFYSLQREDYFALRPKVIAQTPRLIVREYRPEEEDAFVAMHSDEEVIRYLPKRSPDEYRKLFREGLEAYRGDTGLARWGIFEPLTGDFIGSCLLRHPVDAPEKVELGYSLRPDYWGKGIATEMARELIAYGFNRLGFDEITAVTDPENSASQNVLQKAGMQRQGEAFWYGQMLPYFVVAR